ncbi:hypothetical protein, partial [Rodentibacter trehalosifermentans]|uniref:hypothetical protein n=1 Tax=Rodentibacter trehalosifermentans TaxID=1908263 RepID=UPI001ABF607E
IIFILFLYIVLNGLRIGKIDLLLVVLSLFLTVYFDHYLFTVAFFIIASLALFYALTYIKFNYNVILIPLFLGVCSIFLLYFTGFLEGRTLIDESDYAIGNKESFGFSHPNKASLLLAQLIALSFLFKRKSILILFLFIYVITFYELGGRTALGGIICFFLFYFIERLINKKSFTTLVRWGCVSFLFIYPIVIYLFISQGMFEFFGVNFDSVTNTRLSLLREMYLENNGLHILPSRLGAQFTDSGIANFLVGGGVFLYALFVFSIYRYLKLESDTRFILLLIFNIVICLVESFINANIISSVIMFARIIFVFKEEEKWQD